MLGHCSREPRRYISIVSRASRMCWEGTRCCSLIFVCTVILFALKYFAGVWGCSHADERVFVKGWHDPHLCCVILSARRHTCQQRLRWRNKLYANLSSRISCVPNDHGNVLTVSFIFTHFFSSISTMRPSSNFPASVPHPSPFSILRSSFFSWNSFLSLENPKDFFS